MTSTLTPPMRSSTPPLKVGDGRAAEEAEDVVQGRG